jgi:nucleotide-binding universal stress UspA family protein
MYKHILIATDGSELATKGLEHGLALAKPLSAKVTVLTVTEPLRTEAAQAAIAGGADDPFGRYDQQINQNMKERYKSIEQRASQYGITVDLQHEIDEFPAEAITRVVKLKDCDLIVMSSHGRRGIQKLLLGSQTSEVLVKTIVPVLVVR